MQWAASRGISDTTPITESYSPIKLGTVLQPATQTISYEKSTKPAAWVVVLRVK
jgi:hypothetical protein